MNYVLISLKLYVTILLALVAVIGDNLVLYSKIRIFQALVDNATHSIIGGLSWFLVSIYCKRYSYGVIVEVAVSAMIASVIDLDHFAVAKSFSLQDATNIKERPPLHCSTFPLFSCIFLLLISYVMQNNLILQCGLIILTAFASHHTRDATRRGYWFYPFGSTIPTPYIVYISITCSLPYFIFLLHEYLKISQPSNLSRSLVIGV